MKYLTYDYLRASSLISPLLNITIMRFQVTRDRRECSHSQKRGPSSQWQGPRVVVAPMLQPRLETQKGPSQDRFARWYVPRVRERSRVRPHTYTLPPTSMRTQNACMYYIDALTHTYTRTHTNTYTHTHTHIHTHIHTHTHTCTHTHSRVHTHTLTSTQTHTHVEVHEHKYTYIQRI